MGRRPIPPHGTTARAYGSPGYRPRCHCDPCRTVRARHQKHNRINRQLGRSPFTSPDKAQAHVTELHHVMDWDTLAAACGVPFSNLIAIYKGQRKKIRHETEAKILAVAIPTKGDPGQYIDATGTMRRLQALSYVGHSYTAICKAAGTCTNRIVSIANGRQPTVRRHLAERIAAAYPQLAFSPPPKNKHTTRTRNVARQKGWRGPLAWDDIDNPSERPDAEQVIDLELKRDELAALRRAEIEHLASFNLSNHDIANRLDISISTVNAIVRELHGHQRRSRKPAAA
ncbi:hypothetical protein RKD48_006624 [Streptomyces ambofaciens]